MTFVIGAVICLLRLNTVAQTWTNTSSGTGNWEILTMSADGCKLAALTSTSVAITSTDSGDTWQTNNYVAWSGSALASSADGTKLIANLYPGPDGNGIYISTNWGTNWTKNSLNLSYYYAAAFSAFGNILAVSETTSNLIFVSTNSGLTWSSGTAIGPFSSLASSADGTKIYAAPMAYNRPSSGYQIFLSTNFGNNWTATASSTDNWVSLACSADGARIIASGSATYTSTNFGARWILSNTNSGYVASSADGTRFILGALSSPILTSSDSGATWKTNNAPSSWNAVASSADGCELVGANYTKDIWIGRTTPSPKLNLQPASNNIILSWTVPSTNFVLQQSSVLGPGSWTTLTNTFLLNPLNLQYYVTFTNPANNAGFFRLSAP